MLERLARTLIALLVIALLLVPVVICNFFTSISGRLIVIVVCTVVFIITLAGLMRVRTVDLFIAGSAYDDILPLLYCGITELISLQIRDCSDGVHHQCEPALKIVILSGC